LDTANTFTNKEALSLMVQVEFDQKADVMYIWLRKAKYDISEELAENVIIDLDKNGRIIGIEVLGASKNIGKELITKIITTEKIAPKQPKHPANPPIKTHTNHE
jgi:uncharacterized protein YuzE